MNNILDLTGKVALVTGAGQGIGRQVALHFAAHGAAVVINDYVLSRAESVAEEIRSANGRALAVQANVADLAAMKEVVAQANAQLGPVNILVNNAGNAGVNPSHDAAKPFWETGPQAWASFIDVNFIGVLNGLAACIPGMIEQRSGRLITIISDAGRTGEAGLEVYSGAKAGAAGVMRAVARALGRYQITANCVAISATVTPATEERLDSDPELLKKMMEKYVIRRPGQPTDIANMVLFLASDATSWITGQTYPVNGGFSFSL